MIRNISVISLFMAIIMYVRFIVIGDFESVDYKDLNSNIDRLILIFGICGGIVFWFLMFIDCAKNEDANRSIWLILMITIVWFASMAYFFWHFKRIGRKFVKVDRTNL